MIIEKHISIWRLLKIIWKRLALMFFIAVVGAVTVIQFGAQDLTISMVTPSILGTALSIFLGFRTNSAFERWMRAREMWSRISSASVNMGLTLARTEGEAYLNNKTEQPSELAATVMPRMIRRTIAWMWALNWQLKSMPPLQGLAEFLEPNELKSLEGSDNPAMKLLYNQSRDFRKAAREEQFLDGEQFEIVAMMREMVSAQRNAEGLRTTPFPTHYTFFTEVFIWMLIVMLAFALPAVENIGYLSVFFVVVIGWVFSMIDGIGSYMEEPFVNNRNVIPMSFLSRNTEIILRGIALEETSVPPQLADVQGALY